MTNFEPMKEFTNVRDQVNRVIQDTFGSVGRSLPLDIYETDSEVVIVAGPVYGLKPETLDVEVNQGQVTLSGSTQDPLTVADDHYLRRERRFGDFSRSVSLPGRLDLDAAKARYKDGIIMVSFPKLAGTPGNTVKVPLEEESE